MAQYLWGFNDSLQFGKFKGYTVLQVIAQNPKYLYHLHCKGTISLHPVVIEFMKEYMSNPDNITSSDEIKDR